MQHKKKILLVDDSSTVLRFEKMVLSRGPYELVTARTPVILVTARGEPAALASGRAAGCSDHVVEPIGPVELLTKIQALVA